MNIKYWSQAASLLYDEWDLGKTPSKSKGKVCAWVYLMDILAESETIIIETDKGNLIGFCGYAKWDSKRHLIKKRFYSIITNILIHSPFIKDKKAILKYRQDYTYTPEELKNYFDGELSILMVDRKYRGNGLGKKMLLKVCELAKADNMTNLQIIIDESCDFKFYENCGCLKVYETLLPNGEPGKLGKKSSAMGYIFEKKLIQNNFRR